MRYTKLGTTSIKVSVVGLGTGPIGGRWWGGTDEKESINAVNASIDSGVNFIDTAPLYGKGLSEEFVAKAIKGKRDKIILATKCGLRWEINKGLYSSDYAPGEPIYRYLGKESVEYELEQSLKRLDTDYIDLYQTHWQDPTTPIEETMETLLSLKEKGEIRAIGVCNISLKEIREYKKFGQIDSDQEEYNILDRNIEDELMPWCINEHISILTYRTLSKGLLTGKLTPDRKYKGDDERIEEKRFSAENISQTNNLLEKYLRPIADRHNCTLGQVALAWVIKNPKVIALCGARNAKQAVENAGGSDITLDKSDMGKIIDFINNYNE